LRKLEEECRELERESGVWGDVEGEEGAVWKDCGGGDAVETVN
jgi:hypothetical protein